MDESTRVYVAHVLAELFLLVVATVVMVPIALVIALIVQWLFPGTFLIALGICLMLHVMFLVTKLLRAHRRYHRRVQTVAENFSLSFRQASLLDCEAECWRRRWKCDRERALNAVYLGLHRKQGAKKWNRRQLDKEVRETSSRARWGQE